jgi:pimeloyl-ACP methyl ester carboxylesterase
MIPEIDRRFRTVAKPGGRFVAGHSSGGWSSLWLQVTYPDVFGGVWSTSPDPVDFRDFQRIELYADPPQNMFRDPQGARRPIARHGETPTLWFDTFSKMDDVLGRGGQLRSFEAVFSPLDADGQPRRLWDRATGQIDPEVAKAWRAYDIRLKLEQNWNELEAKLRGKLHIRTGSLDTYYLEGAVVRLAETLKRLGSEAQITIVPGADHNTVLGGESFRQSRREMSEVYRRATK